MVNPSQFSWEDFKSNSPKQEAKTPQQIPAEQPKNEFSWGKFSSPSTYQGEPESEEGLLPMLARNFLGNVTRATEAQVGRFGDIEAFIRKGGSKLIKNAGGFLGKYLPELVGEEKFNEYLKLKPHSKFNPSGRETMLPTSQELRERITKPLTGEYLEPKNKPEKFVQEVVSDVASLGRRPQAGRALYNYVGIPAAANAAKAATEELGFGEKEGGWVKGATWTALSLLNNVNAPRYAAELMNEGRNGFQNVAAQTARYQTNIDRVARPMLPGDSRSQLARDQIAAITNDIENGRTTMQDLMTRYDAINAAKRDRGLFDLSRGDRRAAIRNINQVRDAVRSEIETIGRVNPQALNAWRSGVQAFSVIHQSRALTNTMSNWLRGPYAKLIATPVGSIFGLGGAYGLAKAPLVGIPAAIGAPAAYKTIQVAQRVWNDPTLARYYWESINAARQNNQQAFIKNYVALDKAYQEKFKDKEEK